MRSTIRCLVLLASSFPAFTLAAEPGDTEPVVGTTDVKVTDLGSEPANAAPPPTPSEEDERARVALMRELRSAEEEVHDLKERVFRSKATLQLLRELAVEGARSGAELRVTHVDGLGRAYAVDAVQYFLDGKNIWSWTAGDGAEDVPDELQVRDEPIAPGAHNLQVSMMVRGEGRGVFEYLDNYRFKVDSSYPFTVEGGTVTDLRVKAVSKGNVRKKFVERPTVVYEERHEDLKTEGTP